MRLASHLSDSQLSVWAWVTFLVHFTSLVQSLKLPAADPSGNLRAALVSLAHDDDLPAVIISIQQLEETFNSRYQYHWVFFSTEPLSENFRRQTSNATKAVCLYEVIPREHRSLQPGAGEDSRQYTSATPA